MEKKETKPEVIYLKTNKKDQPLTRAYEEKDKRHKINNISNEKVVKIVAILCFYFLSYENYIKNISQ